MNTIHTWMSRYIYKYFPS